MKAKLRQEASQSADEDLAFRFDTNPALRDLLDHLARELAEEYVRLIKRTEGGTEK